MGADGHMVIAGDDGTLITGRRNQWSLMQVDASIILQSVCYFNNEVFVCSAIELFRLHNGIFSPETRFANGDQPGTCMHLLPGTTSVFSQGEKDIFRFTEGEWRRIF